MRPDVIYVATSNAGKLRDFSAAAEAFGIAMEPLPGLREIPAPEEDGETFEANARLKAEYYSRRAPDLWVLADDSGLEVDALSGAPGVRSARFAEDDNFARYTGMTADERNNTCLLERLQSMPEANRSARYLCVLATARNGIVGRTSEGSVEGVILQAPLGSGGFGYDPLFFVPDLGKTMAEIDLANKQKISHRGKALKSLLSKLQV